MVFPSNLPAYLIASNLNVRIQDEGKASGPYDFERSKTTCQSTYTRSYKTGRQAISEREAKEVRNAQQVLQMRRREHRKRTDRAKQSKQIELRNRGLERLQEEMGHSPVSLSCVRSMAHDSMTRYS